jgi:hypothetical protein
MANLSIPAPRIGEKKRPACAGLFQFSIYKESLPLHPPNRFSNLQLIPKP